MVPRYEDVRRNKKESGERKDRKAEDPGEVKVWLIKLSYEYFWRQWLIRDLRCPVRTLATTHERSVGPPLPLSIPEPKKNNLSFPPQGNLLQH